MLNSKAVVVATLAAALSGVATVASAQSDPRYDSYLNLSPQYSEIGRSAGAQYGTVSTEVDPRTDSYLNLSPQYSEIGRRAGAQDEKRPVWKARSAGASIPAELLGSAAPGAAAHYSVAINQGTKWITVTQGDIVKFIANGKDATWNFDGLATSYDLESILGMGAVGRKVTVIVLPQSAAS